MHTPKDGPLPTKSDLALEPALLSHAQTIALLPPTTTSSRSSRNFNPPPHSQAESEAKLEENQEEKDPTALRDAIEAWNLADTEAWRFARAYLARQSVERKKWEAEERGYAGGMGAEKKSAAVGTAGGAAAKGGKKKEEEEGRGGGAGAGAGEETEEGGKRTASKSASALRGAWSRWLDRD